MTTVALALPWFGALWPSSVSADGEVTLAVGLPDDSAFPSISFVMTADRDGRPLKELSAADLHVRENSSPAEVTSVRRAQDSGTPLALVVTVDTSGSMAGASMETAKAAAAALVERLSPRDAVGVVSFSDHARVLQPVAVDRVLATKSIVGLTAQGNTALYDAVSESVRAASESGLPRRAVVMLSDGREFGGASSISREESVDRAARGGAVFYMIGVGPDIDVAYLQEVASRTGGRFFQASGAAEVPQVYAALEELLRTEFVVTIKSAAPAAGAARWLEVEVVSAQGQGARARPYDSRRPAELTAPAAPASTAPPVSRRTVAPLVPNKSAWWTSLPGVSWISTGSPGGAWLWMALGGAVVAALGVGAFIVISRQRRNRRRPVQMRSLWRGAGVVGVDPTATRAHRADVVLRVHSGSSTGTALPLPQGPVDIGWADGCVVRLEPASGVAERHARISWHDGHALIRHLAPGYETRVNGRVVEAAALDLGYEITIGPMLRLRFEAASQSAPAPNSRARRAA